MVSKVCQNIGNLVEFTLETKKMLNFPNFFVKKYETSPKNTLKPCHSVPYFTIVLLSIVVWQPKLPMTKIILIVNGNGDWYLDLN